MKGNTAIRRAMMALTLLTAYLLSTAGTAVLAIGCHCPHSFYHSHSQQCAAHCCSGHCTHAHHTADDGQGLPHLAKRGCECCNHDHSTETKLYTAGDNESKTIRSAVADTYAVAAASDVYSVRLSATAKRFAERRCPPALKCRAFGRPLRAPPVCA